jgi:hypothetical protein
MAIAPCCRRLDMEVVLPGRSIASAGVRMENSMWNPWLALTFQASRLTWDALGVVRLRLMKLAAGGPAAASEASSMITEKVAAFLEAQAVATAAVLEGSNGAHTVKNVLNIYEKNVQANKHRLSK